MWLFDDDNEYKLDIDPLNLPVSVFNNLLIELDLLVCKFGTSEPANKLTILSSVSLF